MEVGKGKLGCKESHEPRSEIVALKKEVSQRSKQQRQAQRKIKFDKD